MFENLIESSGKRQKSIGQTILSVVVHVLVLFGAIKATQGVAETIKAKPVQKDMVLIKPPEPPPPPPPPPQEAVVRAPSDVVVAANPPPKGFQTLVAPTDIPKDIPPVDLNQKPFDPRDFTGKGVEGGSFKGVEGGSGPVNVSGEAVMEAQLDDPVTVTSQPGLRYPPALEAAGIEGNVVLQFIVDTTGRVEGSSIKIISSTNKAFEEPAKEVARKSVFRPAKFRGAGVRALVSQKYSFKTGR